MKCAALDYHLRNRAQGIRAQVGHLYLPYGNSHSGDLSLLDVDVSRVARATVFVDGGSVCCGVDGGMLGMLYGSWWVGVVRSRPACFAMRKDDQQQDANCNYPERPHDRSAVAPARGRDSKGLDRRRTPDLLNRVERYKLEPGNATLTNKGVRQPKRFLSKREWLIPGGKSGRKGYEYNSTQRQTHEFSNTNLRNAQSVPLYNQLGLSRLLAITRNTLTSLIAFTTPSHPRNNATSWRTKRMGSLVSKLRGVGGAS